MPSQSGRPACRRGASPRQPFHGRGEHHPERGDDDVERSVVEGKSFGVTLNPLDFDALTGGALSAALEQLRNVVEPDRVAPGASRRRNRRVAAPAGHVQDALTGDDLGTPGKPLPDERDQPSNHREIALRPGLLLNLLDHFQVDRRLCHVPSLPFVGLTHPSLFRFLRQSCANDHGGSDLLGGRSLTGPAGTLEACG